MSNVKFVLRQYVWLAVNIMCSSCGSKFIVEYHYLLINCNLLLTIFFFFFSTLNERLELSLAYNNSYFKLYSKFSGQIWQKSDLAFQTTIVERHFSK